MVFVDFGSWEFLFSHIFFVQRQDWEDTQKTIRKVCLLRIRSRELYTGFSPDPLFIGNLNF